MRFEYLVPTTIEEVLCLLARYNGKARMIAGGTDVVRQVRRRVIRPECLIDLTKISSLSFINYDDTGGVKIGALTTIRELEESAELKQKHPIISQAAGTLGSMAIRNIATLGGNLCNAAPSADTAPAMLALAARAMIVGANSGRLRPIEDFFAGPGKTALKTGELLAEIQVPALPPHTGTTYLKHSFRGSVDLAIVGVAAVITMEPGTKVCKDIKIGLGAVAPTPIRARKAEEMLKGRQPDSHLIAEAARAASEECACISDVRASAQYRYDMVTVFTRLAVEQAISKALGKQADGQAMSEA